MQNNIDRKFHNQAKPIIIATRSIEIIALYHMRDRDVVTIFFSTHHPSLNPYDG